MAWSDAARAAALEARRLHKKGPAADGGPPIGTKARRDWALGLVGYPTKPKAPPGGYVEHRGFAKGFSRAVHPYIRTLQPGIHQVISFDKKGNRKESSYISKKAANYLLAVVKRSK